MITNSSKVHHQHSSRVQTNIFAFKGLIRGYKNLSASSLCSLLVEEYTELVFMAAVWGSILTSILCHFPLCFVNSDDSKRDRHIGSAAVSLNSFFN